MAVNGAGSVLVPSLLRLSFLTLLCGGALHAQQQFGNIVGQVRLVDGGFPNERIRVTLEARGSLVGVTYGDSEGRFSFNDLLPNAYTVVIETEEYETVRLTVAVNPMTAPTNFVHLVLRPKPIEKPRGAPEGATGGNPDIVDVAELAKKFPPAVIKEFDAGKKAEQHGQLDAAVRHYQAAILQAPDFYPAHNSLGVRALQKGDLKVAEEEFRRVLELNSKSAQACFNLGNVLYLTHRDEEAKQSLDAGLHLSPFNALGHYLQGSVLVRLGDLKSAEEQLKTARELDPKMPQVPISLATLYLQTGREHEATAMFETFLREFPTNPMVPKVRAALTKMAQSPSP
ncbi:MAG TPA: tetratricopeptide repeat protein [Candidatus Acidoferrum sp.]|nr:tetratricopeptide repeat protein [Candidatus Acidoferrum sp.]